jgi:hypothetical protein
MVMTFMPYGNDFKQTAKCLDNARLIKQRLESKMIMATLGGFSDSWSNHPVMHMWNGHLNWLYAYNTAIYEEYANRGFNDNTRKDFDLLYSQICANPLLVSNSEPYWLNCSNTHYTHRGNLFRKKPEHYKDFSIFQDYRKYVCCPDQGHACNTFWVSHFENRLLEDSLYFDKVFKIAPTKRELGPSI